MVMMKASFAVAVQLALTLGLVATTPSTASAQTDPHVGTWKMNLAKSTFNPGPPPQSQTTVMEADGQGFAVLTQSVDEEGKRINPAKNKVTYTVDGKEHPSENPNYDTAVRTRIDANGWEFIHKRGGKVIQTGTNVVSKGGKTTTVTVKGTNAKGEKFSNVIVFDKQ